MWWTRFLSALFVASLAFGTAGCKKEDQPAEEATEEVEEAADEAADAAEEATE